MTSPLSPPLLRLHERVEELYHFRRDIKYNFSGLIDHNRRDHFFESHSISEAALKPQKVSERLDQILKDFKALETEAVEENRARFLYLKGRLLNVTGEFSIQVSNEFFSHFTAVIRNEISS